MVLTFLPSDQHCSVHVDWSFAVSIRISQFNAREVRSWERFWNFFTNSINIGYYVVQRTYLLLYTCASSSFGNNDSYPAVRIKLKNVDFPLLCIFYVILGFPVVKIYQMNISFFVHKEMVTQFVQVEKSAKQFVHKSSVFPYLSIYICFINTNT